MKYSLMMAFNLGLLMLAGAALAQPLQVSSQLLETAIRLYPEASGPYNLTYRSDIRMHSQGFEVINYSLTALGAEVGKVARIRSILAQGSASKIDVLVRYDDAGKIAGILPVPSEEGGEFDPALVSLLHYFQGRDPRALQSMVQTLSSALAGGAIHNDLRAPEPPPEDYVLDLQHKIMTPGDKLANFSAKDISGESFTTKKATGKVILVFSSPECIRCDDMLLAMEKGLDLSGKRKELKVGYVVAAGDAGSKAYAERLDLNGQVLADPVDHLGKMFKIPFKPYALLFDDGELKHLVPWEEESKLLGTLYLFIEGREPQE
mgnify:CR=1 FL=1